MSFAVKRALFFAAHTDDEMACAGTLHRLTREGCEVRTVTFGAAGTEGDPSGEGWGDVAGEWAEAACILGIRHLKHKVGPNSREMAEHGQEIADAAFRAVEEFRPDLVLTLSPDDENPAHAVVGVQTERVMRGRVPVVLRVQFPWNYSIGRPNLYVALTPDDVEAKRRAIRAYRSQRHRYDYEAIFMSQLVTDGESVKVRHAERFELVRAVL